MFGWNGELVWVVKMLKEKVLTTNLLKVGWNAFICQRNSRIFKHREDDAEHILDHIKITIRYRFVRLTKLAADTLNISLWESWGFLI